MTNTGDVAVERPHFKVSEPWSTTSTFFGETVLMLGVVQKAKETYR